MYMLYTFAHAHLIDEWLTSEQGDGRKDALVVVALHRLRVDYDTSELEHERWSDRKAIDYIIYIMFTQHIHTQLLPHDHGVPPYLHFLVWRDP